jgi:hypothetical protein
VGSVILINPDYSLRSFVESGFDQLRAFCAHITLFADTNDIALMGSQLLNRELALGKQPFGLIRPASHGGQEAPPPPPRQRSFLGACWYQIWEDVFGWTQHVPLEAAALDLDVIDLSWLDSNVHGYVRHAYFNINRWLVDDLREIITTGKRAAHRTHRLSHRAHNVWSPMAAPLHVSKS